LLEDSISAIRTIKDGIRSVGGTANVVVTADMLERTRSSYSLYMKHLKEQKSTEAVRKRQKEIDSAKAKDDAEQALKNEAMNKHMRIQKTKLNEEAEKIRVEEQKQQTALKTTELLVSEAEQKLGGAIVAKDMEQVTVAQAMLEVAHKRMQSANTALHEIGLKRDKINSQKRKLDTEEEVSRSKVAKSDTSSATKKCGGLQKNWTGE
jgi:hypothetical protein